MPSIDKLDQEEAGTPFLKSPSKDSICDDSLVRVGEGLIKEASPIKSACGEVLELPVDIQSPTKEKYTFPWTEESWIL